MTGSPLADRLAWVVSNLLIVGKELWFHGDFFAQQFVNPAWSLSIELQFYLVIPFLVRWRTSGLVVLFVAAAAYRGLAFATSAGEVTAIYFQPALAALPVPARRAVLSPARPLPQRGHAAGRAGAGDRHDALLTVLYPHYTESATRADWIKIGYWIALFFTLPLLSRVSRR